MKRTSKQSLEYDLKWKKYCFIQESHKKNIRKIEENGIHICNNKHESVYNQEWRLLKISLRYAERVLIENSKVLCWVM